jgi:hypothetical protein
VAVDQGAAYWPEYSQSTTIRPEFCPVSDKFARRNLDGCHVRHRLDHFIPDQTVSFKI